MFQCNQPDEENLWIDKKWYWLEKKSDYQVNISVYLRLNWSLGENVKLNLAIPHFVYTKNSSYGMEKSTAIVQFSSIVRI